MLIAALVVSAVAVVAVAPLQTATSNCAHGPDPTKRRVDVHVSPWADVEVDGVVVARGRKATHLELAVGPHALRFVNPAAREVERVVVVPADGPAPDVVVTLEPKPTVVVVRGRRAHVDLDVKVEHSGAHRPDASTSQEHRRHVELRPGETTALEVRLDPPSP